MLLPALQAPAGFPKVTEKMTLPEAPPLTVTDWGEEGLKVGAGQPPNASTCSATWMFSAPPPVLGLPPLFLTLTVYNLVTGPATFLPPLTFVSSTSWPIPTMTVRLLMWKWPSGMLVEPAHAGLSRVAAPSQGSPMPSVVEAGAT